MRIATSNETPAADGVPLFLRGTAARAGLTKADAAYTEIRARILACDLPPGSVVDQELLANWLGSSTTPVREALRRLEAEHLVVLRAHSEVRVAPVSIEEFRELHSVRLGLEPIAAEEAAAKASDEAIDELRSYLTPPPGEPDLSRSRGFHRAIYSLSGNHTLTQILDNIWDRVGRYRVMFARVGSVAECASPEHLAIVDALASHDGARAAKLMREDLEITFANILPIFEEAMKAAAAS